MSDDDARSIVSENPDRILAVYIRHISSDPSRGHAIEQLDEETRKSGCDLILAKTSLAMARHAQARGFISRTAVSEVEAACRV